MQLPAVSTAATATEVATTTATTATIARACFTRLRLAYFDSAAFYSCTIQFLDSFLCGCIVRHFNETETTATSSEFVCDNLC
jgi:hypothetical protein